VLEKNKDSMKWWILILVGFCHFFAAEGQKLKSKKGYAKKMADAEIARHPEGWMFHFQKEPVWSYSHGLIGSAMEQVWRHTNDEKYFAYIKKYADEIISEDGSINTYQQEDYNIKNINSGKFLFTLWERTGDPKYEKAIHTLRDQMRTHPRTTEGGFWHKKIYPHQMRLEGVYMATPFLAQYANVFNDASLFDDVAKQIELVDGHLFDSITGLYRHGWDESRKQDWADPTTGLSAEVFSQGMGWLAMSLVDVLDFFPKDHPKRAGILSVVNKVAIGIQHFQDSETGVWFQVMNKGGNAGNYLESSASSMFVYFLLKGLHHGYLDASYRKNALMGYKGILNNFIKMQKDVGMTITDACVGAGLGGNPYRDGSYAYYVNLSKIDNDPKAVAPFIMLSIILENGVK
jgi:unsaturated rhamnogalacturonyl hydrolase